MNNVIREATENRTFPLAKQFSQGAMYCFDITDYVDNIPKGVACFQVVKEHGKESYTVRAYIPDNPFRYSVEECKTYAQVRQTAALMRLRCMSVPA